MNKKNEKEKSTETAKTSVSEKTNDNKTLKKVLKTTMWVVLSIILVIALVALGVFIWVMTRTAGDNGRNDAPTFDTSIEGAVPLDTSIVLPDFPLPEQPPEDPGLDTMKNNENDSSVAVNKDEMFNFLLIGKDAAADNTDVMMLISYNVKEKDIAVMQIPRDTYVCLNYRSYKINALYGIYRTEGENKKVNDPDLYALQQLSEFLEKNICINIHYNAMINLEGFRNVVDILGGVEVDIPTDMYYYDDTQNLTIDLKKGKQLLNGEKAEQFVRFRSGWLQADIGRIDAQKIFMSALLKEVKDHFNISTIIQIADQVFKHVKTDLSLDQMVYLAKNMLSVDLNDMTFMTMPGYSPTPPPYAAWYYVMNRRGVLNIVNEYYNIYDSNVTDAIFDKYKVFTSTTDAAYLNPYYICDPAYVLGGKPQSADDINQGAIDIPKA